MALEKSLLFRTNLGVRLRRPLRFEIRADNRRFREMEASGSTTLASRGRVAKTPPPLFLEKIFCLAGIIREPGDSGHDPGLDEKSKKREIMDVSRTILRQNIAQ